MSKYNIEIDKSTAEEFSMDTFGCEELTSQLISAVVQLLNKADTKKKVLSIIRKHPIAIKVIKNPTEQMFNAYIESAPFIAICDLTIENITVEIVRILYMVDPRILHLFDEGLLVDILNGEVFNMLIAAKAWSQLEYYNFPEHIAYKLKATERRKL